MIEYYVILVIYNKQIDDSIAYKSLQKAAKRSRNKVTFIITDNSTDLDVKSLNHSSLCNDMYIDMQGNKGLSCAYNRAISQIEKKAENWIITSDQDTTFPESLFNELEQAIDAGNGKVYAPKVVNSYSQMSPFYLKFDFKPNIMRVINSGLAIRSDIFTTVRYNEDLFLDFVDYDFVNSLFQKNISIEVTDIRLYQDFSGTDFSNKSSAQKRHEIYLKDATKYYMCWKHSIIAKRFYILKRTINLTLRFKSLSFFKLYTKNK